MSELDNRPIPRRSGPLALLRAPLWQMPFGERAALEGVLVQLQPRLAIEIGTAEGGSLDRLAAHSEEVHSFDLTFELLDREAGREGFPNVVFHAGDSHVLLPELLAGLEREGRSIDFALVDGDHSSEGVRRDVEDLLGSGAVGDAVVLVHDAMNPNVRAGLEAISYERHPKVTYVDLDFVTGYVYRVPSLEGELWGGMALIVTDSDANGRPTGESLHQDRYHDSYELIAGARDTRLELERHRRWLEDVQGSASWRLTAPLRAGARGLRRLRGR